MKKVAVLVAVLFLVAGMVTSALAERETVTTVKEITVLGKPCAVIQTVDRGGPAGKGFFGTTRVAQTTVTVGKKGDLETLSQYGSASDGLGKVAVQGLPNAFALGGMQIIAAGQIRPDRTNTTVNVPVSGVSKANTGPLNQTMNPTLQQQQGQTDGFCSPVTNKQ